jgi:hypothetical protein
MADRKTWTKEILLPRSQESMQAVFDSDRRFIYLSILNPGSASSSPDFLKAGLTRLW